MKCFADNGTSCDALREKNCEGCKFYKSEANHLITAMKDTLRDIERYRGLISEQKLKTLIGQAKSGDVKGARKGLIRLIRSGGL